MAASVKRKKRAATLAGFALPDLLVVVTTIAAIEISGVLLPRSSYILGS